VCGVVGCKVGLLWGVTAVSGVLCSMVCLLWGFTAVSGDWAVGLVYCGELQR
jgi:hypothetical protein